MSQVENEKKSLVVDCEQGEKDAEPVPLFSLRSHRLRIGLLLMFGLWASVSMRLNLSMAVTCMVNTTAVSPPIVEYNESYTVSSTCSRQLDDVTDAQSGYDGDLLWTPSMQSLLLSATFYGGLVTIAISGYIADRFAPKIILICTTLNYVLMSLLAPWLARTSYYLYFASRVVMGLGEGFVMPSLASLAARWFPATERSTVAAMYTSGNQLAAGLCPVISAALCAGSFLGGWPAIFVAFAAVGLLWLVLWGTLASNYPADNRWTSQAEKDYLHGITHNNNKKRSPVPWWSMLCSAPVLANLACQFSFQMCAAIMQGFLPTYFKQVLALPLASNGLYTMIPFMCQLPAKNILAGLSDYMKRRGILAPTTAVKLFQSIGSFGSSAALLGLALLPSCDRPWIAAGLLAVYGTCFSCGICGFFTSILTIAPAHTGTLASMAMVFGMIGNITGPALISTIADRDSVSVWLSVFGACAGANLLSGCLFLCWGSADVQQWARQGEEEERKEEEKEEMREVNK